MTHHNKWNERGKILDTQTRHEHQKSMKIALLPTKKAHSQPNFPKYYTQRDLSHIPSRSENLCELTHASVKHEKHALHQVSCFQGFLVGKLVSIGCLKQH